MRGMSDLALFFVSMWTCDIVSDKRGFAVLWYVCGLFFCIEMCECHSLVSLRTHVQQQIWLEKIVSLRRRK